MVCSRESRIFAAQQNKARMDREKAGRTVRFVLVILALAGLLVVMA